MPARTYYLFRRELTSPTVAGQNFVLARQHKGLYRAGESAQGRDMASLVNDLSRYITDSPDKALICSPFEDKPGEEMKLHLIRRVDDLTTIPALSTDILGNKTDRQVTEAEIIAFRQAYAKRFPMSFGNPSARSRIPSREATPAELA